MESKRGVKEKKREPLFVGIYIRDSVVSESEKLADVSLTIFSAFKKREKQK